MSTNTETARKLQATPAGAAEQRLNARNARLVQNEQGADADPFADTPEQTAAAQTNAAAPAGGASADPFADAADKNAAESVAAQAVEEAESGGIAGLFGSAMAAVTNSGLLGPVTGLAGILYAAASADSANPEEIFFAPSPEASRTSVGSAEVGGQDAEGNMAALTLEDTAIRAGGNEEPIIYSESLVVGNSSGEAPGGVPVTIEVSEEAPIFMINGGALAQGDVMVNALQTSVSASNLVSDALTQPEVLLADPVNTNLSSVSIGGQAVPIPSDVTQPPSSGDSGSSGGSSAPGIPMSADDFQAAIGGGADAGSSLSPMSSSAGANDAFAPVVPNAGV